MPVGGNDAERRRVPTGPRRRAQRAGHLRASYHRGCGSDVVPGRTGDRDSKTTGDAALCLAYTDGDIAAMGLRKRHGAHFFRHMAELAKIMAHPRARGLGLGARVTQALIDSATNAGIETRQLGVRGNNHLAIELYEQLGFREWGRLPNVIEVGNERFDDVRMFLDLGRPAHLILHGHAPHGPGASAAQRTRPH